MNQPIIIANGLSKSYDIGTLERAQGSWMQQVRDFTVREAISRQARAVARLARRGRPKAPEADELFWALRGVSFEVKRGEIIGLIGRNGAGKSTLLKILSRIVEPSEGTVRLRGRVASLLEVGTGFHPDLSGRENIYLNGAILGMRKAEIQRKFDEIVGFAEVERFLDTPVKRYSSGMCVRLAFAVAAHLEPEILIVDEVLAVGDHAFQQKCLGKMHEVASGDGRTVLFVSHNMGVLAQLCQHGIYLDRGRIKMIGPMKEVVQTYLRSSLDEEAGRARFVADPTAPAQFVAAELLRPDGAPGSEFSCDDPLTIRIQYEVRQPIAANVLSLQLQTIEGICVLHSDVRDADPAATERLGVGRHVFEVRIPPQLLAPATYLLTLDSRSPYLGAIDHRHTCCEFTLRDFSSRGASRPGVLGARLPWEWREGNGRPGREAAIGAPPAAAPSHDQGPL